MPRPHKYREAFHLMRYREMNVDNPKEEVIWNSRDGVTPFIIASKDGNEMCHVDWTHDSYAPHYELQEGDRYFANMSMERAKFLAKHWIETYPQAMQEIEKANGYSVKEYLFILANEYFGGGSSPTILEHGQDTITYLSPVYRKVVL